MFNSKWIFKYILPLFTPLALLADPSEKIYLTPEQVLKSQIEILQVAPIALKRTFTVPAKITVNERNQAVVVAKTPGIVTQVSKNIGDPVKIGETLAILESKEIS